MTDLAITGVNVANYSFSSLTTGTALTGDFEAVWTLTAPLATDKLRIRLDGTTGGAVTDTAANNLDGDWADTVSTYPSGDDVAGGDFAFRFNVLPADFNGDGLVSLNPDVQNLLNGNGPMITSGDYSHFIDLNGDGFVALNPDVQILMNQSGTSLPAGDPSGPGTVTAGSSGPGRIAATTESTSETAKPSATPAALAHVVAIPPQAHAIWRHLDVTRLGRAHGMIESTIVDVLGTFRARLATTRGMVDLNELDSEDSTYLLAEVGPIF